MSTILEGLTAAEKRAVALIKMSIDIYGGKNGTGRFSGVDRYPVLAGRIKLDAARSQSIRSFWDRLASSMQWPVPPTKYDLALLALITPHDDTEHATLSALADGSMSIVMIARALHRADRPSEAIDNEIATLPPVPNYDDPFDVFTTIAPVAPDDAEDEPSTNDDQPDIFSLTQ